MAERMENMLRGGNTHKHRGREKLLGGINTKTAKNSKKCGRFNLGTDHLI